MRKVVRRIVIGIAVLLGLMLVLFAASRWRGAPPGQRAALEVMRAPSDLPGENAFAALWLLRYDVPEPQQAAVAAEDVRRFAARPSPENNVFQGPFESVAEGRYDDLFRKAGSEPCSQDCLAYVRARPDEYRDWPQRHARLVERVSALSRYGHHRTGFDLRLDMPMPLLGGHAEATTAHAVAFVQGLRDEALERVCGDAGTWRRLMPNSDLLIVSMIATVHYDRSLQLFADMLAELPPGHALPEACRVAFAVPSPEDSSMCAVMKGEFAFTQAAVRYLEDDPRAAPFFDREMTAARMAHGMARACTNDPAPTRPRTVEARPWWRSLMQFECVSNLAGCVLADIPDGLYDQYLLRGRDHATRLHAGAELVRMHEAQGTSGTQPTALKHLDHGLRIDAAARTLMFDLKGRTTPEVERLPLPSSRVDAGGVATTGTAGGTGASAAAP